MFEKYTLRWTAAWLAIGWLLVAAVVVGSLVPAGVDVPGAQGDKVVHAFAYAALMFWFSQIYSEHRTRLLVAFALAMMGVLIEYAQGYTGYRTFDYADMAANAVGVLLGWLAAPPRLTNLLVLVESWT